MQISPSLLSASPIHLKDQLSLLKKYGVGRLHLDILDGHFAPNLSYGCDYAKALTAYWPGTVDVHLMIKPIKTLLESFIKARPHLISFHIESLENHKNIMTKIKERGCRVGLAISPQTSIHKAFHYLEHIDQLLIMSVNPGFGGQKFIPETLDKIATVSALGRSIAIAVDGGINEGNIRQCKEAGAHIAIVGSALFDDDLQKMEQKLQALKQCINI